jgi:hypothetical protein
MTLPSGSGTPGLCYTPFGLNLSMPIERILALRQVLGPLNHFRKP